MNNTVNAVIDQVGWCLTSALIVRSLVAPTPERTASVEDYLQRVYTSPAIARYIAKMNDATLPPSNLLEVYRSIVEMRAAALQLRRDLTPYMWEYVKRAA